MNTHDYPGGPLALPDDPRRLIEGQLRILESMVSPNGAVLASPSQMIENVFAAASPSNV